MNSDINIVSKLIKYSLTYYKILTYMKLCGIMGPNKLKLVKHQYSNTSYRGVKGGPQLAPIMPRGQSLYDSCWKYFQSGCMIPI